MSKHINEAMCPSCEDKLKDAHAQIAEWFKKIALAVKSDAHVSWSYRGKESQEQAFNEGKSKLHYPDSAHNKTDESGKPCARALDLFQLDDQGRACFPPGWYHDIAEESEKQSCPIFWGGHFKSLGDADHFELKKEE